MAKPRKRTIVGRRAFLKQAALSSAAAITATPVAGGAQPAAAPATSSDPLPPRPTAATAASQEFTHRPNGVTYSSCGANHMVEVLDSLNVPYLAATPGNTFLGLLEAVMNHHNARVKLIKTLHEESSAALAHGFVKADGRLMACMVHANVGMQHASMGFCNASADLAPILGMMGYFADPGEAVGEVAWRHFSREPGNIVRDYAKSIYHAATLPEFGGTVVNAYRQAMTAPCGPTLVCVDTLVQENPIPGGAANAPPIPLLVHATQPAGEEGAVELAARMLVRAENPVIYAGRAARTPEGLRKLVQLAEALQAAVFDGGERFNMPWRHPLNQSHDLNALLRTADVLLMLEVDDPLDVVTRRTPDDQRRSALPAGAQIIHISSRVIAPRGNDGASAQRDAPNITLDVAGDPEATLPMLLERVNREMPARRRALLRVRGRALAEAHAAALQRSKDEARRGWNSRPISLARLCMELHEQLKDTDWTLASSSNFQSRWPQRLWHADQHHNYLGGSGAYGIGYMSAAGVGAALANQPHGRLTVSIVGDGDLLMGPGILWTAAHYQIPWLCIVHNNRGWHMEKMQIAQIAARLEHGVHRAVTACTIQDPNIDFATIAKGMGVYGQGPIEDPAELGPALKRAIDEVKQGRPALIDVISEGR